MQEQQGQILYDHARYRGRCDRARPEPAFAKNQQTLSQMFEC